MSDYVNRLLDNLIELSQEEKRIAAEIDAAHKEYNDYCSDSEKDLSKKIEEIHDKMNKLEHFIDYARQHAAPGGLEQATEPFDTSEGTLESIRQTIKLDSNNDPNAETLFTKATGKKLYYEQEIERTRKLIEGSRVQAKRQLESDVAKLNNGKDEHFGRVREYVQSGEFSEYLKFLVYDKSAFNSPGTIKLSDDEHISLGQRRVKLSVPMEIEQDVAISSNGEYNAAARTIGAPFYVSSKKGGTLFLEHDERNGQYLLGGIQRMLLNFVKYFGDNLSSVIFCEPERFSVENLGNISALGMGINPLITVPKTMEEASGKLMRFAAKAEAEPTPDKVSRILVLQEFPERYPSEIVNRVVELCRSAEQCGALVVLTHSVPMDIVPEEAEIRRIATVIRSRNGGFWVEKLHESLFWYSAPSDISEEVRQKYVEKRRQDALKAAQESAPVEASVPVEQPVAVSAPVTEPRPVEQPAMVSVPVAEPRPVEQPVAVSAPVAEPKPVESPVTVSAPVAEPKPVEPPVTVSVPVAEPKPVEQPAMVSAPVAEPKPVEPPVAVSAPVAEPKPVESPVTVSAPVAEPKPVEPPVAVSAPVAEPKPVEPPVAVSAPVAEPKPVEPPVAVSAPVAEPKPVEPLVTVSAPVAEPKPVEQPVAVSAPVAEPKPVESPVTVSAPVAEPKPVEPPVTVSAPVEEPMPVEPPMMVSAPAEEPMPVEQPMMVSAPAEEPMPVEQPVPVDAPVEEPSLDDELDSSEMMDVADLFDTSDFGEQERTEENEPEEIDEPEEVDEPEEIDEPDMSVANEPSDYDDNLKSLSVDDNGEPIPAHILFSVPRPKPEQKDVTMTVLSELNDQLPPPVEEPVQVMQDPFDYVDYRPAEKLDPELTYRITDRPAVKPAEPEPTPAPEPEKQRASILDVIDAGRRKIGAFVDNRKADIAAKRAEQTVQTPDITGDIVPPPADVAAAAAFVPNEVSAAPVNDFDMSSAPAAEPAPAPEPAPVIEEPPVEEIFSKGVRRLPDIPIGKNVDGDLIDLNISGGITYICGNRSDERKTIVDRVISQIIADSHPDDVELWLFDCGEGDFIKYTDDPDEHIKYLVSDIGADTAADVADIISGEMERRVEMFTENGWASMDDIPADVFMPRIVVAVNAFPKFSENIFGTQKYFGRNYNNRLSNMFKRGISYGIHFLLIGDKFSENGEYPACLEGCSIHSAVAISGRDRYAHLIFSSIKMYDNEKESLKNIPAGCAFTADVNSSDGLTLVRISGENAVNRHTYKKVSVYSEDVEEYLDKLPFIGDRRNASVFDDLSDYRAEQIKAREEDECLLFLGEPCRFMGQYPVRLFDDFGENILTIAPTRDKGSVALVVRAALKSLEEQGIKAEILAGRGNPVYKELIQTGELDNITVFEGARAEERIKDIATMLDAGDRSDVFEVILGGDLLVASMNADDMLPVLKRALVNGPRMGVHFMFVSGSIAQMESGFLSLFRHKLVYACPYTEAEKLLRDPNCDLPENGFRLSNDYDELTLLPYQM